MSSFEINTMSNPPVPPASSKMIGGCGNGTCGTKSSSNNGGDTGFPYIKNQTTPCGHANCGIPPQTYLDQGMEAQYGGKLSPVQQTNKKMEGDHEKSMFPYFKQDGNLLKPDYYKYAAPPYQRVMSDAYSGRISQNKKNAADFEAWHRYMGAPSRRYPLGDLPVQDRRLAAMKPLGTSAKVGLAVGGVVLLAGIIGGGVYMMRKRKRNTVSFNTM